MRESTHLKKVADDMLQLIKDGRYEATDGTKVDFQAQQKAAELGTHLYRPGDFPKTLTRFEAADFDGQVEVIDATTSKAALANADEDLALLNFASARNPGGGFLKGAKAQEEDLCRCSGLYPCLITQPDYYDSNRREKCLVYTDHLIYSPKVPFFKSSGEGELLAEPYYPNVITCPAPNAAELRKNPDAGPALVAGFLRRWAMVLWVAQEHGHRTLLLGAWGCGAFGNQAEDSVETIHQCLNSKAFADSFDRVIFAIPDRGKRSARNLAAFRARFMSS